MKILITGGSGLIGTSLIDELRADRMRFDITVLTRNIANTKKNMPSYVNIIDNLDDINLATFCAVVNLAGEPIVNKRWSAEQKQCLCDSRWNTTTILVEKINRECSPASPIRLLSGSAVGIYGRQGEKKITEEVTQYHQEFSSELCQQWESIALQAKPATVCLLRTGIVLDADNGALAKMLLPFRLGLGGKVASGKQYMPWIHRRDMARAIVFLLKRPHIQGPINCTAPTPVTNLELSRTLAAVIHRPCVFPVPECVLRVVMGEMADLLVHGQQVIPQKLLDGGFTFRFERIDEALNDLLVA